MKIKTSELQGPALDWAVAKCEGATDFWFDTVATHWVKLHGEDRALRYGWAQSYLPSTDWAQGGPIIEREKIGFKYTGTGLEFVAWVNGELCTAHDQYGPTPLIAAMRCYVVSKLGDEVEVPDDLK